MKFAKLFEVSDEHQILYTLDEEENSDAPYIIGLTTHFDGVKVSLKLGYSDEVKCAKEFEEIDQNRAELNFKNILSQLSDS